MVAIRVACSRTQTIFIILHGTFGVVSLSSIFASVVTSTCCSLWRLCGAPFNPKIRPRLIRITTEWMLRCEDCRMKFVNKIPLRKSCTKSRLRQSRTYTMHRFRLNFCFLFQQNSAHTNLSSFKSFSAPSSCARVC